MSKKLFILPLLFVAVGCSNQPHVQTGINAAACGAGGAGIGLLATGSGKIAAGAGLASGALCGAATEVWDWYQDQQEENEPHWHNGRHG